MDTSEQEKSRLLAGDGSSGEHTENCIISDSAQPVLMEATETDSPSGTDEGLVGLVCRNGFVMLWKTDLPLLIKHLGARAATVFAVWVSLITLANDRRSNSIKVSGNLIRYGAGASIRTVWNALRELEKLGFVRIDRHRVPGKKENDESTYTILRSCTAYTTSRTKRTTGSGNKCVTGHARDEALRLQSSSKKGAKAPYKERASSRPSSAVAEKAQAAQTNLQPRPFYSR